MFDRNFEGRLWTMRQRRPKMVSLINPAQDNSSKNIRARASAPNITSEVETQDTDYCYSSCTPRDTISTQNVNFT